LTAIFWYIEIYIRILIPSARVAGSKAQPLGMDTPCEKPSQTALEDATQRQEEKNQSEVEL